MGGNIKQVNLKGEESGGFIYTFGEDRHSPQPPMDFTFSGKHWVSDSSDGGCCSMYSRLIDGGSEWESGVA